MSTSEWLAALSKLYPRDRLLIDAAELTSYESDALTAYRIRPAAAVIPESQEEVIETVKLCHRFKVPFVARGNSPATTCVHFRKTSMRSSRTQPAADRA